MSPNFGIPPWKRAVSRVVFYLAFVALLTSFDAVGVVEPVAIDYSAWSNAELGAAIPVNGELVE